LFGISSQNNLLSNNQEVLDELHAIRKIQTEQTKIIEQYRAHLENISHASTTRSAYEGLSSVSTTVGYEGLWPPILKIDDTKSPLERTRRQARDVLVNLQRIVGDLERLEKSAEQTERNVCKPANSQTQVTD
jgi:hypothetical protein